MVRWCGCCGHLELPCTATTTVSLSVMGPAQCQYIHHAAWRPSYPLCLFGLYLDLNICAAKIVCRHQEQVNVWAGLCILISKAVIMVTSHTQLSTNQSRGRWSGDQLWTNHRPAQLQQTGPLLAGAELTAASSPRLSNNFNNFILYIFCISSLRLISRIMVYCCPLFLPCS